MISFTLMLEKGITLEKRVRCFRNGHGAKPFYAALDSALCLDIDHLERFSNLLNN